MKGLTIMEKEIEIFEDGIEEYPIAGIIFGNIMLILWIALGTIACWFFYPIVGWIYLVFVVVMVGIVLRKLVCTNCYYYDKWCPIGWGRLAALFFKKGNIEDFASSPVIKLAPLIYGLLHLTPIILVIVSIIQEFAILKIAVLILLLLIGLYSATVGRKKTCAKCKMRLMCPAGATK